MPIKDWRSLYGKRKWQELHDEAAENKDREEAAWEEIVTNSGIEPYVWVDPYEEDQEEE